MKFRRKAQSLVEYGLILALVAVIAIAALNVLGKKVNNAATTAGQTVEQSSSNAASSYCTSIGGTLTNGVCKTN